MEIETGDGGLRRAEAEGRRRVTSWNEDLGGGPERWWSPGDLGEIGPKESRTRYTMWVEKTFDYGERELKSTSSLLTETPVMRELVEVS